PRPRSYLDRLRLAEEAARLMSFVGWAESSRPTETLAARGGPRRLGPPYKNETSTPRRHPAKDTRPAAVSAGPFRPAGLSFIAIGTPGRPKLAAAQPKKSAPSPPPSRSPIFAVGGQRRPTRRGRHEGGGVRALGRPGRGTAGPRRAG